MIRRQQKSTLFPYTTLFRSSHRSRYVEIERRKTDRGTADVSGGLSNRTACAFDSDRKSTRLNSSHSQISYAVFCLKKISNRNYNFDVKYIRDLLKQITNPLI